MFKRALVISTIILSFLFTFASTSFAGHHEGQKHSNAAKKHHGKMKKKAHKAKKKHKKKMEKAKKKAKPAVEEAPSADDSMDMDLDGE